MRSHDPDEAFQTGQEARDRCRLSCEARGPRPIRSAGEYVSACRELIYRHGLGLPTDPEYLAPGYCHHPPATWLGLRAPDQADCPPERPGQWRDCWFEPDPASSPCASWIAYWRATQQRYEKPGSPYSEPADAVAAWWRRGTHPDAHPYGYAYLLLTGRGDGGPRRVQAILAVARAVPVRCADEGRWIPGRTSTRDLRRLSRLTPGMLRYCAAREQAQVRPGLWAGSRLDTSRLALAAVEWCRYQRGGWQTLRNLGPRRLQLWARLQQGDPCAIDELAQRTLRAAQHTLEEAAQQAERCARQAEERLQQAEERLQQAEDSLQQVGERLRQTEEAVRQAEQQKVCARVRAGNFSTRAAALELDDAPRGIVREEWARQVAAEAVAEQERARKLAERQAMAEQAAVEKQEYAARLARNAAERERRAAVEDETIARQLAARNAKLAEHRAELARELTKSQKPRLVPTWGLHKRLLEWD